MRVLSQPPFTFAPVPGRIGFPGHSLTLVVKGTFDLHPGGPATMAKEQFYPTGDEYWPEDEEHAGPIRCASDFAPLKPATDLLLVGTCHAPGGKPVGACEVAFQVGEHRRVLRVSGDRYWEERGGRWVASEPEPFVEMPLTWARAFGGAAAGPETGSGESAGSSPRRSQGAGTKPGSGEVYAPNPVGIGRADLICEGGVPRRPLPNIEDPAAVVTSPDDRPEPAGFGPLSPLWTQRQSKLGSYGDDYVERRWPWFPEDFDWGYFNAAPPALQKEGYLRGDEPLVLENVHPEHPRYASSLPGLRVRCFVTRPGEGGEERFDEVEMRLDTLWVDADAERLILLWRGWAAVADEDFEEIGHIFVTAEPAADPPRPGEHHRARFAEKLAKEAARRGGTRAEQPAEGAATAAAQPGPSPAGRVTGPPALGGKAGIAREAAGPRASDPRDRELGDLFESVMSRVQVATGLNLAAVDLTDPDAVTAKIEEYLRSQGIDPDRVPELTPEQRQAQAGFFEGLGIPWDSAAGQPDLDRLRDIDMEALLRRTLEKLDADLAARGLSAREPPPLKPEDIERLRAIGIDAEAFLAYLKSQEPTTAGEAGEKPLDRHTVQERAASGKSLAGADLSGLDLSDLDLAGADLSGANLSGAKLAQAVLAGANLSRANLAGASLAHARLANARLSEADLTGADLTGADASAADLTAIVGEAAILREALLHRATATGAYLARADLSDADARGL